MTNSQMEQVLVDEVRKLNKKLRRHYTNKRVDLKKCLSTMDHDEKRMWELWIAEDGSSTLMYSTELMALMEGVIIGLGVAMENTEFSQLPHARQFHLPKGPSVETLAKIMGLTVEDVIETQHPAQACNCLLEVDKRKKLDEVVDKTLKTEKKPKRAKARKSKGGK